MLIAAAGMYVMVLTLSTGLSLRIASVAPDRKEAVLEPNLPYLLRELDFDAARVAPFQFNATETGYAMGEEIYPQAIGATVREAWRVAQVAVHVTEKSLSTEGRHPVGGLPGGRGRHGRRVPGRRHRGAGIHRMSAFDNDDWIFGDGPKFGLIAVDGTTQVRTPKPSVYRFEPVHRS